MTSSRVMYWDSISSRLKRLDSGRGGHVTEYRTRIARRGRWGQRDATRCATRSTHYGHKGWYSSFWLWPKSRNYGHKSGTMKEQWSFSFNFRHFVFHAKISALQCQRKVDQIHSLPGAERWSSAWADARVSESEHAGECSKMQKNLHFLIWNRAKWSTMSCPFFDSIFNQPSHLCAYSLEGEPFLEHEYAEWAHKYRMLIFKYTSRAFFASLLLKRIFTSNYFLFLVVFRLCIYFLSLTFKSCNNKFKKRSIPYPLLV